MTSRQVSQTRTTYFTMLLNSQADMMNVVHLHARKMSINLFSYATEERCEGCGWVANATSTHIPETYRKAPFCEKGVRSEGRKSTKKIWRSINNFSSFRNTFFQRERARKLKFNCVVDAYLVSLNVLWNPSPCLYRIRNSCSKTKSFTTSCEKNTFTRPKWLFTN